MCQSEAADVLCIHDRCLYCVCVSARMSELLCAVVVTVSSPRDVIHQFDHQYTDWQIYVAHIQPEACSVSPPTSFPFFALPSASFTGLFCSCPLLIFYFFSWSCSASNLSLALSHVITDFVSRTFFSLHLLFTVVSFMCLIYSVFSFCACL